MTKRYHSWIQSYNDQKNAFSNYNKLILQYNYAKRICFGYFTNMIISIHQSR
jgi:hypothetical protein